jgi:drug/metabolite transporter (DMT)-like permease
MTAVVNKVMGPLEWCLLIGLSILWGGSFFFSKVALAELPPFAVVFGRVCLAAVALNLAVYATGNRMPRALRCWRPLFIMGALNNLIPFSLIFWGQTQIASGLASILNSTTPLFTVVIAHFCTRDEQLTTNRLSGVLFGLLGVAVMLGPDALHGLGVNVLAQDRRPRCGVVLCVRWDLRSAVQGRPSAGYRSRPSHGYLGDDAASPASR